ncbi:murein hydrolase activator EnvC family protein [Streptomyces sp. NPDC057654]|uniref:murein hydrolase activator EnvC family protein n=1 Tax=Streptomyces sp. NPDC057654 TaxID=3346196 RepID=UPI0036CEF09D
MRRLTTTACTALLWILTTLCMTLCATNAHALDTRTPPAIGPDSRRTAPTAADGPARSWPVSGAGGAPRPLVVRAWEPPPTPWAAGHRGVDLAARAGQAVRAAGGGTVSFAGTVAGRGVLSVELSGTGSPPLRTTYEPVRATARAGDRVAAGETVGVLRAGPSHCAAACLHWGLLRGHRYLDPLSLLPPEMLGGGPSRLLPVFGVPVGSLALSPAVLPATTGGPLATPAAHAPRRLRPAAWSGDTSPGHVITAAALVAAAVWAYRALRAAQRTRRVPGGDRTGAKNIDGRRAAAGGAGGRGVRPGGPRAREAGRPRQPRTPRRAMATAASVMRSGSSAAPSSMRRTAASTTP